ncbi:MAG TPA: radical SAM protein [Planctomycetaceae bacterium]|nr:radical SAM protein [Gimesia sp.]HAH44793.1 radical SAM protein [Planctomycetaceae bacterium]HBL44614.1 radical SAM protein [Planctomycetaceae bacterium]|tara:strand:- start:9704 stop:10534 length:831 start_codon:yes stop_codon:yes gene_type:complete
MQIQMIKSDIIALAMQHYSNCHLCEHHCGCNRTQGESGFCKASSEARVFRHRVEYGEEMELIPSHLFYLSGCDLRCAFCIAEEKAFNPRIGTVLTTEFLEAAIEQGKSQGAHNIQWVGGEPTIHIPAILEAMSGCCNLPRVVWKSDFYGTPEAFQLLEPIVDVFVADFKFGNNTCARRISKVNSYVETLQRNLKQVFSHSDLIVRHLLLPEHEECCFRPIVDWIAVNLPGVKFSIRNGYLPRWQARHYVELSKPLETRAADSAIAYAEYRGLNLIT